MNVSCFSGGWEISNGKRHLIKNNTLETVIRTLWSCKKSGGGRQEKYQVNMVKRVKNNTLRLEKQ
jgi:hypothetical protein